MWIENINQELRDNLFSKKKGVRDDACLKFCSYIDEVMSASYGKQLVVTHRCKGLLDSLNRLHREKDDGIFVEMPAQTLRNARNQEHSRLIKGEIICCSKCGKLKTTQDIVNLSLIMMETKGT